jgi:hypothetical protein
VEGRGRKGVKGEGRNGGRRKECEGRKRGRRGRKEGGERKEGEGRKEGSEGRKERRKVISKRGMSMSEDKREEVLANDVASAQNKQQKGRQVR